MTPLSGVDTANGSKVIAFSNVDLQKIKIAGGGQDGGIFRHFSADRFLLSRGIFEPKGMFVAFVVSSQYISLHPHRQTSRHPDRHPDIRRLDSITQIHS
jgi:hypothetical protein